MPRIVACMKLYDALETRMAGVFDHVSDELVEAVHYSFIKYRQDALKELPKDQGSPLEGPQDLKQMMASIKAELQDTAHKIGEALVAGMAKSLAENMPLYRMTKVVAAVERPQDALLSLVPSRQTVLDMILGEKAKARLGMGALEILDDEEPAEKVSEEIKLLEDELAKINTESHFALDIKLFERMIWQSTTLRKRIWLYVFHLGNFFWNATEAEKARSNEGIVKMMLWAAGAIFSAFELRKSASYRNFLSFSCYTPERMGLTVMKISFLALLVLQIGMFTSFQNLTYDQSLDKTLEKVFFSVIGATIVSIGSLTMLKRGYEMRVDKRKEDLAKHKARLHELLAQRQALLKND